MTTFILYSSTYDYIYIHYYTYVSMGMLHQYTRIGLHSACTQISTRKERDWTGLTCTENSKFASASSFTAKGTGGGGGEGRGGVERGQEGEEGRGGE